VTVGESETAGPVVVARWQVRHDRLSQIGGVLHVGAEEPVVDPVGMLIDKDPGVGGLHEVGVLQDCETKPEMNTRKFTPRNSKI
jgi:hypothetical protein